MIRTRVARSCRVGYLAAYSLGEVARRHSSHRVFTVGGDDE